MKHLWWASAASLLVACSQSDSVAPSAPASDKVAAAGTEISPNPVPSPSASQFTHQFTHQFTGAETDRVSGSCNLDATLTNRSDDTLSTVYANYTVRSRSADGAKGADQSLDLTALIASDGLRGDAPLQPGETRSFPLVAVSIPCSEIRSVSLTAFGCVGQGGAAASAVGCDTGGLRVDNQTSLEIGL